MNWLGDLIMTGYSNKSLSRSIKVPGLKEWAAMKVKAHHDKSRLPFIKKIRILEKMTRIVYEDCGASK